MYPRARDGVPLDLSHVERPMWLVVDDMPVVRIVPD